MRRSSFLLYVVAGFLFTCITVLPVFAAPAESEHPILCKPYVWLFGDWVVAPRIPLIGDVNGDGFADFLYASPGATSIDCSLNGRGWKPIRGNTPISNLPQGIATACLGRFGGKQLDVMVLGDKGRLSKVLNDGTGAFGTAKRVAYLSDVKAPAWIVAVKTDPGKMTDDVAVITGSGRVRVIDSQTGAVLLDETVPGSVVNAAAGDVDGNGVSELACRIGGSVCVYRLGATLTQMASVSAPKGPEALAVGDANADGKTDLFVSGTLLLGPRLRDRVTIPGWSKEKLPMLASMADVVGRGRADLIIQKRGKEYYGSFDTDVRLYVSALPRDIDFDCDGLTNAEEASLKTDPLDRDTDYDGLPDGWEVHGFWGMNFAGQGANPLRKDVFVFNSLAEEAPSDQFNTFMQDSIVPFYAKLSYKNLDGTQGFALHPVELPKIPKDVHSKKGWGELSDIYFPKEKIGLSHWLFMSGMSGGGQSGQLADSGASGAWSWIHEFGHQLGLSHSGKWPNWSPTYTSLMNYCYSYQFDGDGAKTHYSTGELAGFILNESRMRKKVPYPIEKLKFLAGPPYRFRMKPAGKNATYVDWDWSGIFKDQVVRANVTFGYSVGAGPTTQPNGKTTSLEGPYQMYTDYQAVLALHQGKLYMLTVTRQPVDVSAARPGKGELVIQTYKGKSIWSDPVSLAKDVTGDPFAISDGTTFYVFYPTAEGIMLSVGQPDKLSDPQLIPDTKGAAASAIDWNGTVYAFFHFDAEKPILYRTIKGTAFGPVIDSGIKSTIPVGLGIDTIQHQLLLGMAEPMDKQPYRWQLRRLVYDEKSGTFKEVSKEWLGGEKAGWAGNRRPSILFSVDRNFGKDGRVYWIAAGLIQGNPGAAGLYVAQTISYKDVNGGWLLWRYGNEWVNTRSGITATWFDKDIVYATTWAAGTANGDCGVYLAYQGTSISDYDMSDYDDISLMANYGIARSIQTFAIMPPAR